MNSRILNFTFLLVAISAAQAKAQTPVTHSALYQSMEQDSPARKAFIKSHNASTMNALKASANYIPTQNLIYQLFDRAQIIKQVVLDSTRTLKLINRGLGKSTDVVLSTTGAADVVLVSNFQLFGITVVDEIIDFDISPDQKLIYITTTKNGSIDAVSAQIYDLVNRKVLPTVLNFNYQTLFWSSPTTLIYTVIKPDGTSSGFQFNVTTQITTPMVGPTVVLDARNGFLIGYYNYQYNLRDLTTGIDTKILGAPQKIVSVDANNVYLLMSTTDGNGAVNSFKRNSASPSPAGDTGTPVITSSDRTIRSAVGIPNAFLISVRNGSDRTLRVYDSTGSTTMAEILIPSCCSFGAAAWVDPATRTALKVSLSSAIHGSTVFTYDLIQKTFDRDPNVEMLTLNGVMFTSTIEYAKSSDGTLIPVRLTARNDLTKNQNNPVLFQSYGGFGVAGYFDPAYDLNNLEFLKRGGILAGPALRGGNEFDGAWKSLATRTNKIRTYQDLAASAQMVASEGWTTPAKIISTGASNGGLTVSATALLFPNTFGLIIPAGGVHDFLGRDRMDPEFKGWDSEYGSDTEASMIASITAVSPLENTAAQGNTEFLILDGKSDTRVNIAHSLKLTAALEAETNPHAQVNLLSVKDAGHFLQASSYSNMKAWFTDTVTWTKIFDRCGWTIVSP